MSAAGAAARSSSFDEHTAVLGRPGGRWRARVAPELSGFAGAHGGYLAAIALRALGEIVGDGARVARSLTVHLLAPVSPGALELSGAVERAGSTMTYASLRIHREGAAVLTALGSFGRERDSVAHQGAVMPDVPAPNECRPLLEKPVEQAQAGLLVEHRPAAAPLPLSGGERAEILVWMRLLEDRPLDALCACMLADAGPPALYGLLSSYVAMPSTEITLHFADVAAAAASPWLLGVFRTRSAGGGYAVEDGELWTPGGQLVLHERQQRRIL